MLLREVLCSSLHPEKNLMPEGLEHYSKDQLIEELINRQTFVGIVVFHRGDAKAGRLEPGETVITKSPPLTREGVEALLSMGASLVPGMFVEPASGERGRLPFEATLPPLRLDEGVAKVGKSRISLDLIVEQYENGMTPEDMVRSYDTLILSDAHAAIAYYLTHRREVQEYLAQRKEQADTLRARIESERPRLSREGLVARRTEMSDAAARQ
jgi:uncharacterized protein (DUF433 family)